MEFDWSEEKGGFSSDKLDRAKYAKFLTDFLVSRKDESYVMNLNAEWGAGKTYFLQRWFHEIKDAHPATYIDAWKNDFSEDPLLTVISAITETLGSNCNVAAEKYKKTMLKKGARLMKQLAPALLKGVLKTYTGVDANKVADDDKFNLDNFNDAAVKALEIGLSEHQEKIESLKIFKITISNWLKDVVSTGSEGIIEKPMFVFIDELDRCRPTYAIELLETVKHLFDIPGLIFVIATDTDQLQHSIKAVYGEGFDASRYLYRFFNRSFSLKKPDLQDFISTLPVFQNILSKQLLETLNGILIVENENKLANNFSNIAENFNFDLRTCSQWLDQISAIYLSEENIKKYSWITISILVAIKLKKPNLFDNYMKDKARQNSEKKIEHIWIECLNNKPLCLFISIKPTFIEYILNEENSFSQGYREKEKNITLSMTNLFVDVITFKKFSNTQELIEILKTVYPRMGGSLTPRGYDLLMYYNQVEQSVTKDNYIDLVEMASDLK